MNLPHSKSFLIAEAAFLMLALPLIMWWWLPPRAILGVLWGMALICYFLARAADPERKTGSWKFAAINRKNLKWVLPRFIICALMMTAFTWALKPELLFNFVLERPKVWLMVMCLYPILSVIPQEIIYRRYCFARYVRLLPAPLLMGAVSGLSFGFAHVVFDNWVAPALCAVGGVIFAHTYHRTRSLALVCLEHALYGNFVFTVGLGRFFYHGAVGQ